MKLALLSNVGLDLVADLFRPEDEVWLAPGFGAWRQTCLEPPQTLVDFAPEMVALLIDTSSDGKKDERQETRDASAEIRDAIEKIRRALPGAAVVRVDLEDLADEVGPQFFDPRIKVLAGCPWSLAGQKAIVNEIRRLVAVRYAPPKKVLAVDFDGVLWRHTLSEDGAAALEMSVDFQKGLLALKGRGVLLVGLTKNEAEDLKSVWTLPQMVLGEDDFAAIRANWKPKAENLAAVARELNLGTDAFVFADDNPWECVSMRDAYPEVAVEPVASPDAKAVRRLARLYFPDFGATDVDRRRTDFYHEEAARRTAAEGLSLDAYLASLGTVVDFHAARADEVPRLAQLSQRCNQFNVRQARLTEADLARLAADPSRLVFSASVRDRFGDFGLVSLVVVALSDRAATLEEWVMSCRAMNRRIENEIWRLLRAELEARGIKSIVAEVRPTAKNAPIHNLFLALCALPRGVDFCGEKSV